MKLALAISASVLLTIFPEAPTWAQTISADDYPRNAMRNHEEGTVLYDLTIGTNGRVKDCTIVQPSGSASLDLQTCKILQARARFKPATDARGNRIEDHFQGHIKWKIR